MSDIGPYGVTQNADAARITANELVGERVGLTTGDAVMSGVGPALHSTAPYKKPKPKPSQRGARGCYGNDGTCGAPALRGGDYCVGHSHEFERERRGEHAPRRGH